ncbi:hypothetical protein Dda_8759 [Drechslerella dactyloides]|uniref:carboxypeptidase C n=1 Tax=Drechslerella dactyloides TaxID=74499 RepID=A0AAD6IQZ3_DREDA|nr:hypothetical protein Dda_8759 [Drechslerella dactyloides]
MAFPKHQHNTKGSLSPVQIPRQTLLFFGCKEDRAGLVLAKRTPLQLSLNDKASIIFLDQPVGVGFSFDGENKTAVNTSDGAAKDVYAFLVNFFKEFPQYSRQPFHIDGVSFAGHYIPAIATEILSSANSGINLRSISINNGWIDPSTHYTSVAKFACGADPKYPTALSNEHCTSIAKSAVECQQKLQIAYNSSSSIEQASATYYCNKNILHYYETNSKKSPYDIRQNTTSPTGFFDEDILKTMPNKDGWFYNNLRRPEVVEAIGASKDFPFAGGLTTQVLRDFMNSGDWGKSLAPLIPGILAKIPVLLYYGEADVICNWLGGRDVVEQLQWPGQKTFNNASMTPWNFAGKQLGEYKTAEGLTFVKIDNMGHGPGSKHDPQRAIVINLLHSFIAKHGQFNV